jgi:hypothetical protein
MVQEVLILIIGENYLIVLRGNSKVETVSTLLVDDCEQFNTVALQITYFTYGLKTYMYCTKNASENMPGFE